MSNSLKCEIIWNQLNVDEWESRFQKIKRSNMLQSYNYALATCKTNHQRARWGLIKIDGVEAGLVQIIEASFCFKIFHGIILDRGPLWFEKFGGAAHIAAFFKEFNTQFPNRIGRKKRIIPEVSSGMTAEKILSQTGMVLKSETEKYQTLWWDLTLEEENALDAMKGNWRNALKKAEKENLEISWHTAKDKNGHFYDLFKRYYLEDKENKGYSGVSPQLLDNLALFSTPQNPMIIGIAKNNGSDVAGILLLTHGQSATYQIGWSSQEGRNKNAHQLLLWRARFMLHSSGIQDLDLGGINNDKSAQGIKKFKQGTGAELSTLVGHYS